MTQELPEPVRFIRRPWRRNRVWSGLSRSIAALTAFALLFSQLVIPAAAAEQNNLPRWLTEEEGGWISTDQAQALQRADQALLARLTAVEEAAQRFVTQHPGGVQALHVGQDLLVTRDSSNNLLFTPVLDENGELQEGTLVAEDGTLQVYQEGRLVRQVDPLGTETFFGTDGSPTHEIALDGTRTDYSYPDQGQSPAGTIPFVIGTTHLPNGDLTQTYDSQWRLTGATHPDGRSFSYSEGRLVSAQIAGVTYLYTHETAADGSVTAALSGGEGTDLARTLTYGVDGSLAEVTRADGSVVRFTQGLPTQWVDPLGVVTDLTAEQSGRLITSLSVSREEVVRQYGRSGELTSLTLPDQSVLTLVDQAIQALRLPDGTRITSAEFDENSALVSGLVTLPDGRVITYAGGQSIEARLPDGGSIRYTNGEPTKLTMPDGAGYLLTLRQAQGDREAGWIATRNPDVIPVQTGIDPRFREDDTLTQLIYSEEWVLQEAVRADGAVLTYAVIASPEGAQQSRLSTLTQADGAVISYGYDDTGRLSSTVAVSADPAAPILRTEYAYDRIRQVLKTDPLAAASAMTQTFPDGVVARYEPVGTGAGRRWELIQLTLPDGQIVIDPADPALEAYLYPVDSSAAPPAPALSPDQLLQPGPPLADQNGVGLVSGRVGNAAHFTRNQTQSLASSNSPDVSLGDIDFTLSTWVYFDTATANRVVLSKGTTFNNVEYILYTENNPHNIRFLISNSGKVTGRGTDYQLVDSAPISTQTWYHVLVTYNAQTDQLSLYLDNVLQGTTILSGGAYAGSSPLEMGHSPSWAEYMDGRIDETGIWKRLLSEQERADLFNGSRPTENASLTQGLAAFWMMEESGGARESRQWNGIEPAASESSTLESPPAVPAATLEEHPALRAMRLSWEEEALRRLVSDGTVQLVAGAAAAPEPIYRYSYEFESSSEITVIQEIATGLTKRYRAGQLVSQTDPDGAVTTYEYTADPQGYIDPLETALEAIHTLADGTSIRYQRLSPGSDEWLPVEATLPDGRKITQFGKPGNPLITHNAVRSAPGKAGNAAHMNAADKAYLSVEDCPELSMGDADFTVAAWVYLESETSEVTLGKGDSNYSSTIEYILYLTGQGTNRFFRFAVGNGSIWAGVSSSQTDIAPGRWYYVMAWYDATRDRINIQVDNGPVDSMAYTGGSYDSIQPFAIGRHPNVDSGYWSGMIDEVGIWKKVLTDQERAELYQAGAGNPFSPSEYRFQFDSGGSLANRLAAYYTLDEETGIRSDATETPPLSELTGETALPTDRAALQRLIDQGSLQLIQPAAAAASEGTVPAQGLSPVQPASVLARSTITYQGKPRETFTYRYEYAPGTVPATDPSAGGPAGGLSPVLTYVTDSSGVTRAYNAANQFVALDQPDGTHYEISYDRDLSESQILRIANLHSNDPELLSILQHPEGDRIVTHRLTRLALPDGSTTESNFPAETVVEQEFDAFGNLISRTQANGQVTLYEDNRPVRTYDSQGNLTTTFDYDAAGRLTKITLLAARRELADRMTQLKAEIPARRSQALEELARQRGVVIDQVQSQFSSARSQLNSQFSTLQSQLSNLENTRAHGRRGRRQKNEAMDQIRGAINQVHDAQNNLEAQYAQALGQLESQVESVRQQIEAESANALPEIEAQSTEFHREILRQEISSIVISTYRSTIGRDPSDQEFQEEVQRLYDRYGTDPAAALDLTDLTQRIQALPDYSTRVDQVAAIKQQVTAWLTHYVQTSGTVPERGLSPEAVGMISELGLSPTEVVSLSSSDVERVLAWLNSRSLHFGHSAFLALQEYLQGQSPAGTVPDLITLATEAILTDILTGVINPKMNSNADLEISLFTLGKLARHTGAGAVPASVRFEDLSQILTAGPAIAHVNGNHYILVTGIDADGVVTYREPNAGSAGQTLTMTRADFQKIWEGNVLSARAPPHAHQILTDREAQRITGSFFGSFVSWIVKLIPFHNQIANLLENIATWINDTLSHTFPLLAPVLNTLASFLRGDFKQGFKQLWKITVQAAFETAALAASFLIGGPVGASAYLVSRTVSGTLQDAGVDPETARIAGTATGAIAGNFNPAHPVSSTLAATAQVATETALVKNDVDPALASLAGIGANVITTSFTQGIKVPSAYDPVTKQPIPDSQVPWRTATRLEGLSYTLSTQLAPTLADELAFYGIQRLGESIGLDPRISQLAGIPIRTSLTGVLGGSNSSQIMKSIGDGLVRGATQVGFDFLGDKAGLDPFLTALSSRALTSAVAAGLNPHTNVFDELGRAFWSSAGRILTADGQYQRTPYERALYLAKVNDFADVVREQGLAAALERHASSILTRDAVESVWQAGGIASILAGNTKFTTLNGVPLKEVKINNNATLYFHADDDVLLGRQIGNRLEWGTFGLGEDGAFFLRDGSITVDMEVAQVRIRVKDGEMLGASTDIKATDKSLVVKPADGLPIKYDQNGTLQNGIIENTFTGVKVVVTDGFVAQLFVPNPDGSEATTNILQSVALKNLPPDQLFGAVRFALSNGVANLSPEGLPAEYMKNFGDALAADPSINPQEVMALPLYEKGNVVKDVFSWLLDALGTNLITNEVIHKMDAEILARGGVPSQGMTVVTYSGAYNPTLKAIRERGYNISTIVAVGGPTLMAHEIPDQVKRIVYVAGDRDTVPLVEHGKPDYRHKDGTPVETIFVNLTNSAINPETGKPIGVSHTQYFAWDNTTDPYILATHQLLATLTRFSQSELDPRDFLRRKSSQISDDDTFVLDVSKELS